MSTSEKIRKLIDGFNQTEDKTARFEINAEIIKAIQQKPVNEVLDLTNLNILDLNLSGLNLSNTDFSGGVIRNVSFVNSNLTNATFRSYSTRKKQVSANFSGATCVGTSFANCDIRESIFDDKSILNDAGFRRAWLSRRVLLSLIPFCISEPGKQPQFSLDDISLQDEDLRYLRFSNLYLRRVYYKGANLEGAIFLNTDISGSFFNKAKNFNMYIVENAVNKSFASYPINSVDKEKKLKAELKNVPRINTFFKPKGDAKESTYGPDRRIRKPR